MKNADIPGPLGLSDFGSYPRSLGLAEFPCAQVLSTSETVRAEEIVMQVPDGRSVTTLVNAGQVLTHDQLLRRVWGLTNTGDVRVIRTLVRRLRRKLDDDASSPTYIFAEPRVGYRMPKGQETGEGTG